jgi:hypothetical protein
MYEPVDWESKHRRLYSEEKMKPLVDLVKELEKISGGLCEVRTGRPPSL